MPEFIAVAKTSEIPENSAARVDVAGRPIAIYNLNGEYFATDDTCTHAHASLSEGQISGDEIVCPLHFATFDIRTGQVTCGPAFEDLRSYPVRVTGDTIEILVSESDE
jgi:nitrite reductase/ring-hydroxylating ferredoxin subunit